MTARNTLGELLDPCSWSGGTVIGVPCDQVNPIYHLSGDPVNQSGWIHTHACDQRMFTNIGPFELPANEKVDIWTAYIVGRGNNNLNSVTKLKEFTSAAHNFYKSNFSQLPLSVDEKHMIADDYYLFQNYPNPFNPITIIRYFIPSEGLVTLKVYDILGQEVKTLVNEFKQANKYEVKFESSGLASGVYIYRIQVNEYNQSKKMIILK
ncbi:MAG: T9SS type A sorting domain-containing protein [Ignavibacterium sp.]|nr:T9SS type A sorting domain-containing protein [Ignavibacterium sp.]